MTARPASSRSTCCRGAFRFATGDSAKNRYIIDTPTGTIGVRGTEFDGWVGGNDGIGYVIRHGGTVILCDDRERCAMCSTTSARSARSAPARSPSSATRASPRASTRATYKRWFLYTENQAPLLRAVLVPQARDCLNSAPSTRTVPRVTMMQAP